jgi:hypothetical protein
VTEVTTFSASPHTGAGYFNGAVIKGDIIYCVPHVSPHVLRIDTTDDSVSKFGSFSTSASVGKWNGGVLVGDFIYCAPYDATAVLKINTTNDTTSTFGSLSGSAKWNGFCDPGNGSIYASPFSRANVLKVNTSTDTISAFGSLGTSSFKWGMFELGASGKMYAPPTAATSVLIVNPATDAISTVSVSVSGTYKFTSGSRYGDAIYCIPRDSRYPLKINTTNDTTSNMTGIDFGIGGSKWIGQAIRNGVVFGAPFAIETIATVNATNQTGTGWLAVPAPPASNKWSSAVLAPNGSIYCIPYSDSRILKITPTGWSVGFLRIGY